ncbi:hypothetical protein MW887_000833 [Aspergillus wentii]|nr:hypothetical protein MW887_000833 [Aspergillus wentii]
MPGVPSSRGCEACRKQKKKCDQLKPACSRCARLKIPCVGAGQQRFKFKDQAVALRSNGTTKSPRSISPVEVLLRSPSNEMTVLSSAFVSALEITDTRYDLSCYGGFIKNIPRRLGTNEVLDAAVAAMTPAFSAICSRQQSVEAFTKYGQALNALRVGLNNPVTATSLDTLCAIYLIMICQAWIGASDDNQFTSHGEGMEHVLKAITENNWHDSIDEEMLITLCMPVIIEAIFNPRIKLGSWFHKLTATFIPKRPLVSNDGTPFQCLRLHNIGKLPLFVRDPEAHFFDIQDFYRQLKKEYPILREHTKKAKLQASSTATRKPTMLDIKILSRFQAACGITLSLAVILNRILAAFDPDDVSLDEYSVLFCDDIMLLAKDAGRHRPLGAGYM